MNYKTTFTHLVEETHAHVIVRLLGLGLRLLLGGCGSATSTGGRGSCGGSATTTTSRHRCKLLGALLEQLLEFLKCEEKTVSKETFGTSRYYSKRQNFSWPFSRFTTKIVCRKVVYIEIFSSF